MKHSNEYATAGGYFVEEQYQGIGYGLQTWNAAMAEVNEKSKLAGNSVSDDLLQMFGKIGFRPLWRFHFALSHPFAIANRPNGIHIIEPTESIFSALPQYDTVHVYPRHLFLRKWVFAPNCHCSIAVDTHGDVLGYGVIRTTLGEENEWRIGPVFAQILQSLFPKISV